MTNTVSVSFLKKIDLHHLQLFLNAPKVLNFNDPQ
jgi:hypothetical protein